MKKQNYISLFAILLICYIGSTKMSAQTCTTYSILSTGFNRATQLSYGVTSPTSFDPYWYVTKRQDLDGSYNPTGPVTNFPAGTLAYVISPLYSPPYVISYIIGTARHISLSSSSVSAYGTLNMVTYRTYFTLPALSPVVNYSLSFSLAADDAIYQVNVNGVDLRTAGFTGPGGGAYSNQGPPMNLTINSTNTPAAFVAGSNYIDVTIGDLGLTAFFWEAEILLYQCTDPPTPPSCGDCISSFAPIPGKKYVVSAWTKEQSAAQSKTSYTFPSIEIFYPAGPSGSAGPFYPSGNIIDGWQRIEGEFVIPSSATDIQLKLNCSGSSACYYDDVRVFPFDGSMKSYVYDPVNMRLVAELDERNYATLYEYDEEGKLIRVKKETEKGKMTIKENRDNTKK